MKTKDLNQMENKQASIPKARTSLKHNEEETEEIEIIIKRKRVIPKIENL